MCHAVKPAYWFPRRLTSSKAVYWPRQAGFTGKKASKPRTVFPTALLRRKVGPWELAPQPCHCKCKASGSPLLTPRYTIEGPRSTRFVSYFRPMARRLNGVHFTASLLYTRLTAPGSSQCRLLSRVLRRCTVRVGIEASARPSHPFPTPSPPAPHLLIISSTYPISNIAKHAAPALAPFEAPPSTRQPRKQGWEANCPGDASNRGSAEPP